MFKFSIVFFESLDIHCTGDLHSEAHAFLDLNVRFHYTFSTAHPAAKSYPTPVTNQGFVD